MGDRMPMPATPTSTPKKFNTSYITTCAGTLRILIVVVGITSLILSSVGSPSDLRSRNPQDSADIFYGYGYGYDYEPLNVVYLACLSLAWIFSFVFLLVLGFERSHGYAVKTNRLLYALFGLIVLGGVGCGAVGTYYFWRGCCNIAFASSSTPKGYLARLKGYSAGPTDVGWCRCTIKYQGTGGDIYRETFTMSDPVLKSNNQILSAWPHHFTTHCIGIALAFVDGILYFFAACLA